MFFFITRPFVGSRNRYVLFKRTIANADFWNFFVFLHYYCVEFLEGSFVGDIKILSHFYVSHADLSILLVHFFLGLFRY